MKTQSLAGRLSAVAFATLVMASAAHAEESVTGDRGTDMAVDLIVLRPLGIVGTVIGTAGFVIALPFTLPSGTTGETAREWIARPLDYTFNRPLGQFDRCGRDRHVCGDWR